MIHRTLLNGLDVNRSKLNTGFNSTVPDPQNQKERANHHLVELAREHSLSRYRGGNCCQLEQI